MSKTEGSMQEFISCNDIFADAVNYALYQGEQKVHREDLSEAHY